MRDRLPRPGNWRLATQVSALSALLLAALLIIVIIGHNDSRNARRDAEVENAVALGQAIAGIVDGFAQDLEAALNAESVVLMSLSTLDQDTAGPVLNSLIAAQSMLRALFVTDLDGRVIAVDDSGSVGLDLSERPYMIDLMAGASEVWSPGIAGLETGQTIVTYGRPLVDENGETQAYLVAALYPHRLAERFSGRLPEDADISLYDANGFLLHSTTRPDVAVEQRDKSGSLAVRAALLGNVARVDGDVAFFDDEARFGAVAPVPTAGWAVAVTRPLAPLEAGLQERFRWQVARVSLTVLLAGALIAFAAHRIARPLDDLADAADRVARGERPDIPTFEGRAEVGRLAGAMQAMSAAVADREDALVQESARRRILAEASRDFAHAGLDLDEQLDTIARRISDFVGDGCAILLLLPDGRTLQPSFMHHRDAEAQRLGREVLLANPVQVGEGLSGRAAQSGEQRVLRLEEDPEAARATLTQPHWEYFTGTGTHTLAAVPLIARGRVIGTLTIWRSENPEPYTDNDLALLQELAYRAALAIENAQLFEQAAEYAQSVERAMQAHDEFMADVTHDLRNPLTAIRGSAQLLMRQISGGRTPSEERMMGTLTSIDDSITRAMREIDAALDVARLQMGQPLVLATAPVNLVELLRSIAERQQRLTDQHQLIVEAEDEDIIGTWDTARLERAFTNLLDNAIKYSPDGGEIRINIERRLQDASEWTVVSVQDPGIGIPSAALARVFDRFYRAGNVAEIHGSGLGLSGVRHIITAHGGTISVASEEGRGSTFTVHLPDRAPRPEDQPVA